MCDDSLGLMLDVGAEGEMVVVAEGAIVRGSRRCEMLGYCGEGAIIAGIQRTRDN